MLDIDFVRAAFPAFDEPSLRGQAFFENAGGSYACKPVIERLMRFYTQRKVQPYGPFAASRLGGEEMDAARARLAAWMGVLPEEVSFGPSSTQNTYVLAQAFRQSLSARDAIIVTNQDHEANSGPWRRLAEDGIEIREWAIEPETGHLDPAGLERLLDHKVRLVCFPHCSNIVGEINPVADIVKTIHAAGAVACVDGVSFAPHGLPDVGALGADIYLFSSYKTYGPHQGIVVIRRELGEKLPNQAHFFNADAPCKRFTPAGPDHAQIAASAGMIDYFQSLHAHHGLSGDTPVGMGAEVARLMRASEKRLLYPLLAYLGQRNDLRLLGPAEAQKRAPTVAIRTRAPAGVVAARLAERGIMAGGGDFYAVRLIRAMGEDPDRGVLRMSFVHYTQEQEVTRLIEALDAVL
ncbi:MAG: aminotransferase class V-fold PLP-dependent enzyme [Paracoccaceae bacterium]